MSRQDPRGDPKRRPENYFTTVHIGPDKKLFCNLCQTELLPDNSCGKCAIYYQPQEARHDIVIRGLDGREPGPGTTSIPIASVDTPTATPQKPKQKMGADFAALEKAGFKWTSYSETNT